jgi:hypothetical protein
VIEINPLYNGMPCGDLIDLQSCNTQMCPPTNCTVNDWSAWGDCALAQGVSCGIGTQVRVHVCRRVVRDRTMWQTRYREVDTPAYDGGDCLDDLTDVCVIAMLPCTRNDVIATVLRSGMCAVPCPQDCTVSDWSGWSVCDAPCGGGQSTRSRFVTQPVREVVGVFLCVMSWTMCAYAHD